MLSAAKAKSREGFDVVVGVVETHEPAPRRRPCSKGSKSSAPAGHYKRPPPCRDRSRCDLERRPPARAFDELAHSTPGSRHPKRYLDVGGADRRWIDVFTTLNIQHVDSLNRCSLPDYRIRFAETVPDSILDQADDYRSHRSRAGRSDPAVAKAGVMCRTRPNAQSSLFPRLAT